MLQKAVSYFTESFAPKKAWQRLNTKLRMIYGREAYFYNHHKLWESLLSSFRFVTPRAMEYIYGGNTEHYKPFEQQSGYDLTVTDRRDTAVSSEIIVGDTSARKAR